MKFIIKPFSEIMIKSKPVRKRLLSILQNNLILSLKKIDEQIKVHHFWDKLEVNYMGDLEESKIIQVIKVLSRIPGIESFLEVSAFLLTEEKDKIFDFVFGKTKEFYLDKIEGKSFVVRVKRSGNHNFTSIDLERYVGGSLLKSSKNARVDVHNGDITVKIEIKDNNLYIVKNSFVGIGGYPVGAQDKVLSLISGGFDSGVSTFSMMKRGCKVDYLFFNLGGNAHELGVKQISKYLWENFSSGYKAKFITIEFGEVVKDILLKVDSRYRAIVLKRLFITVASKLAEDYGYYALVKGDSLGQVSSQTLKNMFIIDKASSSLVLRPLISFNKQEIINISKSIGTYNYACNMPEYCGVVSDNPATGAKLEDILKQEQKLDLSLLDKVIEIKKFEDISEVLADINNHSRLEIVYIPGENEFIVDIREQEKRDKNPLVIEGLGVLSIPFFDINHSFSSLDQTKTYLFYCDKGILSELHGLYLKEKGFNNIKIYRPLEKGCKLNSFKRDF